MNVEATKIELIQLLLKTQKESLLAKIKQVFEEESQSDWWDNLSDDEKEEIKKGLQQADRNEVVSHESAMKAFNKWR